MDKKRCSDCKRTREVAAFSRNRAKKDGLMTECRDCRRAILQKTRERRQVENLADVPKPIGQKTCSRCREEKALVEFVRDNSRKDGFGHRCKPCQKDYHREWRERSTTFAEYQKNYYAENREYINSRNRAYYETNKEWLLPLMNQRRFEQKYGITQEQALDLLATQNGCAICHTQSPGSKGWCVDHDHETGEVRGILCGKCNSGIAFLGDQAASVAQALDYLTSREEASFSPATDVNQ